MHTHKTKYTYGCTHNQKHSLSRCDVFKVRSAGLGDVENVVLRHDNSGVGPGWYVEWVEVRCVGGEGVRHFPCGRWLDASESGALQCELTPAAKEDSSTSKTQGTSWGALLYRLVLLCDPISNEITVGVHDTVHAMCV